jgi:hypothetical protein
MLAHSRLLRQPSFDLLLSLAALVLLQPLAEQLRGGIPVLAALHLAVLGLAVRWVASTRSEKRWIWILAAPTLAANLGAFAAEQPALTTASLAMLAVFYAFVIRCLIAYVLRDAVVTVDELFAATCAYVLMAMVFSCVYAIQEQLMPGSFSFPSSLAAGSATRSWDLLYFSFTVLTSTGFGDIHPLGRQARSLVMIEQVAGVMYVAILIARLTGMNLVRRLPPAG